ncbi:MAG: AbrB family transcriptional regulator [Phycisphaerae bacterium]|nr:AbrB family transcriptional regulator [Phycisphaerae bacterium]
MAARLRLAPDDKIFAVETEDGILLTPYDSETQKQLAIAAKVAKKHRAVFRQLAK